MTPQLLLLLAVGLGLSVAHYANTYTAYVPGHEFVYRYESQVVNGLPDSASVFSIYKVICNARIQCKTATKCLLALADAQIFKKTAAITGIDPTRAQVPPSLLEPVTGAEAMAVIAQLVKPIIFKYDRGLIQDILTAPDEPYWSINFKRGVVNMFQINLDGRKALPISAAPVAMPAVYRVMESCPVGECETLYEVQPTSVVAGHAAIAVKKTRNYKNCIETPYFVIDSVNAEKCVGCAKQPAEALVPSAYISVFLHGTETSFIVQSAVAETRFTVLPYGRMSTPVVACTIQTMQLVTSIPVQVAIPEPRGLMSQPEGLKLYIPERAMVEAQLTVAGPHMYAPAQWLPITAATMAAAAHAMPDHGKIEMAGKMLSTIAALIAKPGLNLKEAPTYMRLLIETLRNCSGAEMKVIVQRFGTMQAGEAVAAITPKKMLWNIAAIAGTYPAVAVLCDALVAGQIPAAQAEAILSKIGYHAIATPVVAKKLIETAQCVAVKAVQNAKQSAWLAVGSIMYRMTTIVRAQEQQRILAKAKIAAVVAHVGGDAGLERLLARIERRVTVARQNCLAVRTEFIEVVKAIIHGAVAVPDIVMAIKAIGNAGLPGFLPILVAKTMDVTLPNFIRAQAIIAMRRIATVAPEMVLEAIIPIYLDMGADEQVRVAAFAVIVECKPPFAVWQLVANSLKTEINNQVGSFVYSFIEQMSTSTYPCACDCAVNAKLALYQATAFLKGPQYSKVIHTPINWEYLNSAVAISAWYIGSRASIIPQAANIKIQAAVAGYDVTPIEIGWHSQGMEEVIAQLAAQLGSVVETLSNRPPKRGSSPGEDVIRSIMASLNIASPAVADPQANVYIKFFGNTVQFYVINKASLMAIIAETPAILSTGVGIDAMDAFNVAETHLMAPTEAGMICRLHIITPAIAGVQGSVAVHTTPAIAQAIAQRQLPEKVNIVAELKPIYVKELFAHVSVDALTRQAGVATRVLSMAGDVTVKAIVSVNVKTGAASIQMDAPTEAKDILKVEAVPVAFIRKLPFVVGAGAAAAAGVVPIAEEVEITHTADALVIPINIKYGGRALGVELSAVGKIARSYSMCGGPVASTAFCPFIGKEAISIRATPGVSSGTSIEILAAIGKATSAPAVSASVPSSWASKFNPLSAWWASTGAQAAHVTEMGMADLDTSAVFTADVARRLQMPGVAEADQAAVAITARVNGGAVKRVIQSEFLLQRLANTKQHKIAVLIKRTPIPGVETRPWQAEAQIVVVDNRQAIGVETLMSAGYQQAIAEQIKLLDCKACAGAIQGLLGQEAVIFQKMVAIKAPVVVPAVVDHRVLGIIMKQVAIAKQIMQAMIAVDQEVPAASLIPQVATAVAACKSIMQEVVHIIATECGVGKAAVRGPSCAGCAAQIQLARVAVQQAAILAYIQPVIRYVQQAAAAGQQTMFSWSGPAEKAQALIQQHEAQTVAAIQAADAVIQAVLVHQSCAWHVSKAMIQTAPISASCRFAWGPMDRPTANQIIVEAAVKKSAMQLVFESFQVDPIARHPAITKLVAGATSMEPAMLAHVKQIEVDANTMRAVVVKIDATGAIFPAAVQAAVVATHESIKYSWYSNAYVSRAAAAVTPAGTAIISANLWMNGRKVTAVLATPFEEDMFVGIPIGPLTMALVSYVATVPGVVGPAFFQVPSAIAKPADMCVVQGTHVQTFDGKAFALAIPAVKECHMVLAMDCSAQTAFAVILKEAPGEKVVIVATLHDKVEVVIPVAAPQEPRVIVNGQVAVIAVGASFVTGDAQVAEVAHLGLVVINHGAGLIEVKAMHAGVSVQAQGLWIAVKAAPSFRTKLCGMCGNFDGEESNEFWTPQMTLVKSVQAFYASYLVPSLQCDAVKIQAIQVAATAAAVCTPVMKNAVIVQGIKVCISKEPLAVCPAGCIGKGEKIISAAFHCLDARTAAAKILQEQAELRVLRELIDKTTDTHKPVPIPVQCAPVV